MRNPAVTETPANRAVSRPLLHLMLAGILLGCPYLCFMGCPTEDRAATCAKPSEGCRCCGGSRSLPCQQPADAPSDRDHKCDCLCQGAVYDSKAADAVDLLAADWWHVIGSISACVLSDVETDREAVAIPDESQFAGRTLRALCSSWLC